MKNHDFQELVDQNLSGLVWDERKRRRVLRAVSEEGKTVRKYSSATMIIAAVIVLAMATALAAGLGSRVNWLGEVQQESEDTAVPTPIPTTEPQATADAEDIDPHYYDLLDYTKDRELIVLSNAHKGTWSGRTQRISSMDDFTVLMKDSASDFPLPTGIPEGYVFVKGSVEFGCLPQGEYVLTSQTVHPEGFTESHYTVDPSMDFVKGYEMVFKAENDTDYMSIWVSMNISTNPHEYSFGISDDQSARVVQVAGVDNAIIIDSENTSHLAMRKTMSVSQDDLQFAGPEHEPVIETYNEYRIEVGTKRLPEKELVGVFAE